MGSDLREKGRETIDGADGVNLAVAIGKTLRGSVVDVGDQVMGFAVGKVPLGRVLRWRTQRRKVEDRGRRENKKKSRRFFFF